jgi:radical S-adenosyl methionine domain-containing protein 2
MNTHNHVLPISVNLHFWRPCNMRCGFCFATYDDTARAFPRGHLPQASLLRLIDELALHGARKLTFVGGEPTLCPWLGTLITHAKRRGLTTMLVSNGWHLREPDYLQTHLRDLDWLTLSVDSTEAWRNLRSGRAHRGTEIMSVDDIMRIGAQARQMGLRLKLNTVVHAFNHDEDLGSFVAKLQPERWKLFQVLPVEGQNDASFAAFEITSEQFRAFVERHAWLAERDITVVPEHNQDMRGTYAMIDPRGCFYDSVAGKHRYSRPILEVGVVQAWSEVEFSDERFAARGGNYDFDVPLDKLNRRPKAGRPS